MADTESSNPSTPAETDCLVCGSGKSTSKNEILFCDGPNCDIPVHQTCYGVPVVPEGNWYCQRCEDRVSAQNTPACCCPTKSGAFKRTNIPNQYIHVACARFQPSLDITKDPIVFDKELCRKIACSICNSDFGIVAQCHEAGCTNHLHVTCAMAANLMSKSTKRSEIYCEAHRDASILNKVMRATGGGGENVYSESSNTDNSNGSSRRGLAKRTHTKSLFPARSSKRTKYYGESSDSNADSDDDDDSEEEMEENDEEEEEELERGGNSSTTRRSPNSNSSSRSGSQGATSNKTSSSANTTNKLKRPGISRSKSNRRSSDSDAAIDEDDDDGAALGSSSSSSSHSVSPQRKQARAADNPENMTRQRLLQQLAQRGKPGSGRSSISGSSTSFGSGPGGLAAMNIRTLGNAGPPPRSPTMTSLAGGPKMGTNSSSSSGNNTQYTNSNQGSPLLGSADRFPGTENKRTTALPPSLGGHPNPSSPVQSRFPHERASPKMSTMSTFAPPPSSTATTTPSHARQSSQGSFIQPEQQQQQQQQQTNGQHPHHYHQHYQQQQHHHHSQQRTTHDQPMFVDETAKNSILRQNLSQIFSFLQIQVPASPSGTTSANGVQPNGAVSTNGAVQQHGMLEFHPDRLDSYVQALRDSLLGPVDETVTIKSGKPPMSRPVEVALDAKKRNMIVDKVIREVGL